MSTQQDKDKKLIAILNKMVSSPEEYLDEPTAQYLLNNITIEKLQSFSYASHYSIKHMYIEADFWGRVLLHNINYFLENLHNKEDKKYPDRVTLWTELLNAKDSKLLTPPVFEIKLSNKEEQFPKYKGKNYPKYNCNFATIMALVDIPKWSKIKDKQVVGLPLNNPDYLLLGTALLTNDNYYHIPYFNKENNGQEAIATSKEILDILLKAKPLIIEQKLHDEESFTKRVLSSKVTREMLINLEIDDIAPLFSLSSLRAIIKEANSTENVKQKSAMLSGLLALAPAEKWMDAWENKKNFNLIELFDNKFYFAYSKNIVQKESGRGVRKEKSYGYHGTANSFKEELEYFLPAISKKKLDEEQVCHFFHALMRSQDVQAMKIYLTHMPVPPMHKSKQKNDIYDKINDEFHSYKSIVDKDLGEEVFTSWAQWYTAVQAHKLNNQLTQKTEVKPVKKLKL